MPEALKSQLTTEGITEAEKADIYELYIKAIQEPEDVVKFVDYVYRKQFGSVPSIIREDFCGTAINCVEWLNTHPHSKTIGVDIDPEPLEWAQSHLLSDNNFAEKLQLIENDSRFVQTERVDAILALNSGVAYFKKRSELIEYLSNCYETLKPEGMLILEMYAGPEAQTTGLDRINMKNFTAYWEQASFNAVTHEAVNYIHFEFPDGSRLNRAFTYDFRIWSTAELLDAVQEAGFTKREVYCINDDRYTKLPNSMEPTDRVVVSDSWTANIVCYK